MDEGKIVAWRKREGESVAAGEILFEVETDKATMEVESPASGIVRKVLIGEGETAPVATVIALITERPDEPIDEVAPASDATAASAAASTPSALSSSSSAPPADGDRVRSSPAARKRAQQLGVDIGRVTGTGPDGRIITLDVEAAASGVGGAAGAPRAANAGARAGTGSPAGTAAGERRIPLTRMRRAIAEAMTRSVREAPQFRVSRDVDMTAADALRKRAGVSYTDVLIAACARALAKHERFRARLDGDALVISEAVHVGVAVALDDGLIVTVIRDADRKDLAALKAERERLEQGAHAGKLTADALTGAVFTISNLGTLGVDRFEAILDPPQASILAVGRVAERVIARDGRPEIRRVVSLSLSVDHRIADGADAARFLADITTWLESGGEA